MKEYCPFCEIPDERIIHESSLVYAMWDKFPLSPGHAILLPKRHATTWFDATQEEKQSLIASIDRLKILIEEEHVPNGYNIGINSGEAAGQTVPHLHVHVIPRYTGDVEDPRGGVRWAIPNKARYWDE